MITTEFFYPDVNIRVFRFIYILNISSKTFHEPAKLPYTASAWFEVRFHDLAECLIIFFCKAFYIEWIKRLHLFILKSEINATVTSGRCSTSTHMHDQVCEPILIASITPFYCKIIQLFFHIQSLPNQISIYFHLISKVQMQKLFLVYYIQLCYFLQERVSQCHPCQNAQERFL